MKKTWILLMLFILITMSACTNNNKSPEKTIYISAAASFKGPVSEWKNKFEQKHKNVEIKVNFGATGVLVNQIEKGATADLLFAAQDIERYVKNKEAKLFHKEGNIAANDLVFVAGKHVKTPVESIQDIPSEASLGLGDPKWVPAGFYAKEALSNMNIFDQIDRIVYSQNALHLKGLVETGSVDYALLYKTDAVNSKRITILQTIPQKWYPVIEYPVYSLKSEKKEAKDFLQYIRSDEGQGILQKYSFRESVKH
jgi:molybdate transport system substrate-binding protein